MCSQIKQIWVIFHPLEVVGRGSETQLKVGEYLDCIILKFKGYLDASTSKGATIRYPGGGGGWSFCRGQIIYFNRSRRPSENFTFYYMFI